ncbi:MAG TPA: PhoH family protein [Methyloceanibacter sp.]|nr:PhoH family protein [Methyloceanibacter sp.]
MTRVRKAASDKRASAASVNGREEPLVVFFDDIRLVRDLLGDYDANLAVLEDRLGIQAVVNGNVVSLRGPEHSRETAKSVLEQLYGRLAQGEMIGIGEVVGAIRHARTPEPAVEAHQHDAKVPSAQQIRTRKRLITARTPAQSAYLSAMKAHDLVFATGPAGTGKTYLAVAFAASCLESGKCDRLILSRPAVEAGERLGFLPGDMREKVDPYLRPLYDALYDVLAPERVERGLATGMIEIAPLAFMRGRTLSHAMIILDEAQNCTPMQIKMFLTRIGEGSKMLVTGDPTQVDLPTGKDSGLLEAISILEGIDDIAHIAFTGRDVVRRELVGKIVDAYEAAPKRGERHG